MFPDCDSKSKIALKPRIKHQLFIAFKCLPLVEYISRFVIVRLLIDDKYFLNNLEISEIKTMTNKMPGIERENENIDPITTGMFYVRPVSTGVGARLGTEENIDSTDRGQFSGTTDTSSSASSEENSNGSNTSDRPQNNQTSKGSNNGLTKALVGGLIGATLGTLAAALANKRTSQGVNHATKGVGQAAKTVGEGINHAAKGVGQAVKSVTEGVNYAVVGGVADAVKNTAEKAQQAVAGAADAVQNSAQQGSKSVANGEAGIGSQSEVPTAYVLVPVEKERIIERTIVVEPEIIIASDITSSEQDFSQMGTEQNLEQQDFSQMGIDGNLEQGEASQIQDDEQIPPEFQ